MNDQIIFTPGAVFSLLTQIEELQDYDISMDDSSDSIIFKVGESTYRLDPPAADVEISDDSIEEISQIDESAYQDMDIESSEDIEAGIIKQLLKTLAVGGLVRLTTKLLGGKEKR